MELSKLYEFFSDLEFVLIERGWIKEEDDVMERRILSNPTTGMKIYLDFESDDWLVCRTRGGSAGIHVVGMTRSEIEFLLCRNCVHRKVCMHRDKTVPKPFSVTACNEFTEG